jgi:predicted RNA-binding protein
MKVWICSGSPKNWGTAFLTNMWGVKEKFRRLWEKLEKDDILIFYVSSPIKGFVGVGRLKNKFKQSTPLWPEEIKENRVIWPYRYEFSIEFALPSYEWKVKKVSITGLKLPIKAGLNPVKNLEETRLLLKRMDEAWGTELVRLIGEFPEKFKVRKVSTHEEIKEKLMELGRIEKYYVEKEYRFSDIDEKLDVVWKRVPSGYPTYVFEIQIEGNLHQALTKLKHAYDIWNSNIFLITTKDNLEKAQKLLSGSFHEIKNHIRILTVEKINEVYELQIKDNELKKELGLR